MEVEHLKKSLSKWSSARSQCWPETLVPKQSLCQAIVTIPISNNTIPRNQPSPLTPPYPVCLFYALSLLSLRLFCGSLALPPVPTEQQGAATVANFSGTSFFFQSIKEIELCSPVASDCAVLWTLLRPLPLICVWVRYYLLLMWRLRFWTPQMGTFL